MQRFHDKYVPVTESGCWLWLASVDEDGYGRFRSNGKMMKAHRFSYEFHNGTIPADRQLDHLCRVRSCVNPDHLEPVTSRTNILRGDTLAAMHAKKTHCKHGHELTPDNTYRPNENMNWRACRQCGRNRQMRFWSRKQHVSSDS